MCDGHIYRSFIRHLFRRRVSNEQFRASMRLSVQNGMSASVDAIFILSVSSLAAPRRCGPIPLSGVPSEDVLVHSRTTHVHVCVIPGIDRSLLDPCCFCPSLARLLLLSSARFACDVTESNFSSPSSPTACSPSSARDCFLNLTYVPESCTRRNKIVKKP